MYLSGDQVTFLTRHICRKKLQLPCENIAPLAQRYIRGISVEVTTLPPVSCAFYTLRNPNNMSNGDNKILETLFGFKSPLANAEGFLASSRFHAYFLTEKVSDESRK